MSNEYFKNLRKQKVDMTIRPPTISPEPSAPKEPYSSGAAIAKASVEVSFGIGNSTGLKRPSIGAHRAKAPSTAKPPSTPGVNVKPPAPKPETPKALSSTATVGFGKQEPRSAKSKHSARAYFSARSRQPNDA